MATAGARPPATLTARAVVMMTPSQKRELAERAHRFSLSTSELMRRGGMSYDPANEEAVLDGLLALLEANTSAMRASINEAIANMDARATAMTAARAAHDEEMKALRAELLAA